MVSRYTEHSTYLQHKSTNDLIDGIVHVFKAEGMVRVDSHEKPTYYSPALENNRWVVFIKPGKSGWHIIQSTPYDLFSDRSLDSDEMRFIAISQHLHTPGFLLHTGNYGDVLIETNGQNTHISGGWYDYEKNPETEDYQDYYGQKTAYPLSAQSNLLKKLFENSKNPDICKFCGDSEIEIFAQYLASTLIEHDLYAAGDEWHQGAIKLCFEWPAQDRPEPDYVKETFSYEKTPVMHYADGSPMLPNDAVIYISSDFRFYPAKIAGFLSMGHYAAMLEENEPGKRLYQNAEGLMLIKRDSLDFVADAYEWLKEGAESGNAVRQMALGNLYFLGKHLPKDIKKALHWLELATKQDLTIAMEILSDIYLDGIEVKKDAYRGVEYLVKAGNLGAASASYKLGRELWNAQRINFDGERAVSWFTRAADQGHLDAQKFMGDWFSDHRQNSPKDVRKAIQYFEMAAQQGDKEAMYRLGMYYKNGDGAEKNYQRAAELFKTAGAYSNVQHAKYEFAYMQENGFGVEKNEAESFSTYQFLALHEKMPEAACRLAKMYIDGRHVKQDYEQAKQYIQQAIDAKYRDADYLLQMLPGGKFDEAKKLLKNSSKYKPDEIARLALDLCLAEHVEHKALAFKLFLVAAEKGDTDSQLQVGHAYLLGRDCAQNTEKALYWLKKSAWKGYNEALRVLGQAYLNGTGVEQNLRLAARYLRLASIFGSDIVKDDLQSIPFWKRIFYW